MANWERKHADTLAAAVATHCRINPGLDGLNCRLTVVQVVVAQAAKTIATNATNAGELKHYRSKVCEICRTATLYVCAVPVGWTDDCALLRANASVIGAL